MKKVLLNDFIKEYKEIKRDISQSLSRVFSRGYYVLGPEVVDFESKLSKFIGTKYAVGLASGTDALTLAIKSLNLKKDDEILLPANVYPTVFGVALSGYKIKLCDVNPGSLNIDLESIKKVYTKKIKVIIAVHLYGNPVDITPIKNFAKNNGIYLIEDCAQAAGSTYKDKPVGSFGDVSCFSFYPTKNLGAYGDGGAILTNNKEIFEKVKLLRMYGEKERYNSVLLGHNSRLDELQAAILLTKLKYLKRWNNKRHLLAGRYTKGLKGLPVEIVKENPNGKSNYHLFVIKTDQRQKLIEFLKSKDVQTGIHYPYPIHLVDTFKYLGYKKGNFPVSEKEAERVLSLPIHPYLEFSDISHVCDTVKHFFDKSEVSPIEEVKK